MSTTVSLKHDLIPSGIVWTPDKDIEPATVFSGIPSWDDKGRTVVGCLFLDRMFFLKSFDSRLGWSGLGHSYGNVQYFDEIEITLKGAI